MTPSQTAILPDFAATGDRLRHPEMPEVFNIYARITPEIAAAELDKLHETQRPRSSAKLEQYVTDKRNGDWVFNGDALRWDMNGKLIDGQHRLWAIVKSGIASVELCVFGLPPKTIDRIDLGLPRNFRTWLARQIKPQNVGVVGAITNMLWNWQHGNYGFNTVMRTPYSEHLRVAATSPQLQATFLAYRAEIENAAINAAQIKRRLPIGTVTPAVIGFVWMTLRRVDIDHAETFFHALQNEEARVGDEQRAIKLLFRMMQNASVGKKTLKRDSWVWLHYFITAWNAWLMQNPPAESSYRRPPNPGPRTIALPLDPKHLDQEPREVYA